MDGTDGEDEQVNSQDHCILSATADAVTATRADVLQPVSLLGDSIRHPVPLLWGVPSRLCGQSRVHAISDRPELRWYLHRHAGSRFYRPALPQELRETNQGARSGNWRDWWQ